MAELTFPHGHINGEWQKSPLPFGASDAIIQRKIVTVSGAPNVSIELDTVPAGEVWVLTNLGMVYIGTAPASVEFTLTRGAISPILFKQTPIVSGASYSKTGWWVGFPGDKFGLFIVSATNGNTVYCDFTGFKTDVDL